ncbi:putative acetyltransferase [Parvibaculum indicum]|uniref:GNAT family N-acetyltransferase n=1 Tax=Parvibaculum indicum TaxID=562969 RepID=UPI00142273DA|nr:putative acetyltransferase [Parvibaculum indicum]
MSATFDIERAGAGDIPALASVWKDSWYESHAALSFGKEPDQAYFETRAAKLLPDCLIARRKGEAIGLVSWRENELYQLFTLSAAHGTGLAADLMARSERAMHEAGHSRLFLLCRVGNDRARAFYEKRGWHFAQLAPSPEGSIIGYREDAMWRMEKDLG